MEIKTQRLFFSSDSSCCECSGKPCDLMFSSHLHHQHLEQVCSRVLKVCRCTFISAYKMCPDALTHLAALRVGGLSFIRVCLKATVYNEDTWGSGVHRHQALGEGNTTSRGCFKGRLIIRTAFFHLCPLNVKIIFQNGVKCLSVIFMTLKNIIPFYSNLCRPNYKMELR